MIENDYEQLEKLGAVASRPLFQHIKTGGYYYVMAEGLLESNLEEMVIYRSQTDGKIWIRPKSEFYDGRFRRV